MKALVTGGSGFIGSALCLHLVQERSWQVLNVDAMTYAASPLSLARLAGHSNYQFSRTSILDRSALDDLFEAFQPDAVFNLAAESHVDRSIEHAGDFISTNVQGTYCVLEAARAFVAKAKPAQFRFLHVSTDEVFGSLGPTGTFREDTAYQPSSPYSASKAASDHLARAWHHTYGLPTLVTNCSNNYGPRQFPEKLIPLIVINAIRGKELPIFGDGLNIRDWLYVEDHVRALCEVVERGVPGETYNLSAGQELTNIQMVQTICNILDDVRPKGESYAKQIRFVADRPGHDRRYAVDSRKIRRELGWKPQCSFDDGIRQTVLWYLQNEEWWTDILKRTAIGTRQGLLENSQ